MATKAPRNSSNFDSSLSLTAYSIEDTVPVKDSTIYQIQQTKYLVKKQNGVENELFIWLDELAKEGWELIIQPINLGFYIFKKAAQ